MYNLTTWIAFLTFFAATTTQAALLKTKDPSAICNNGQQATFMVSKSKSIIGLYILRVAALLLPPIRIENAKKDINNQPQVKTMV